MNIEIEIPDPPEGWVVGGFRQAHIHELMWSGDGWIACRINTLGKYLVCVKAKPLWEPSPELVGVLRQGWVTRDRNGFCSWHKSKPTLNGLFGWCSNSMQSLMALESNHLPPEEIPWDQCCFKIGEPE